MEGQIQANTLGRLYIICKTCNEFMTSVSVTILPEPTPDMSSSNSLTIYSLLIIRFHYGNRSIDTLKSVYEIHHHFATSI